MLKADPDITSEPLSLPPRLLSSQERGDPLLMRWRLQRVAGIPADLRLSGEGTGLVAAILERHDAIRDMLCKDWGIRLMIGFPSF
jgi:hypothetical protein